MVQINLAGDPATVPAQEDLNDTSQSGASVKKIWYMNLDSNTKRRDFMEQQLAHFKIPSERLPGINISNRTVHWSPAYEQWLQVGASDELKTNDRPSHVFSVWLSQNAVFHKIAESGDSDDLHMMLEDDCLLDDGWEQAVRTNMKDVPDDWDVVRWNTWDNYRDEDHVKNAVYRCKGPFFDGGGGESNPLQYYYMGNHAVITTPKRAKKLLEYFSKTKIFHADALMVAFGKGLNSYAIKDKSMHPLWDFAQDSIVDPSKEGYKAWSERKTTDPFLKQLLSLVMKKVCWVTGCDDTF